METFNKIITMENVNVGWDRSKVYDDINVIGCFNCKEYGHKAINCNNDDVCIIRLKNHRTADCS